MAWIEKRKGRYWYAGFRDIRGNVLRRSTKIPVHGKDRTETARLRARAEIAAAKMEMAVRGEIGAGAHLRRTLNDLIDLAGTGSPDKLSVVADKYLEKAEHQYAKSSYYSVKRIVNNLVDYAGPDSQIESVTSNQIQGLIDKRVAETSPSTASKDRKFLSKFFSDLVKQGVIDRNPVAATFTPKVKANSRVPFSDAEIESILSRCNDEWKRVVNIALMTGLRLTDSARLGRSNYDETNDTVQIVDGKTGKHLVIPVNDKLREYLELEEVSPWLAQRGSGALGKQFAAIMKAAGIDRLPEKRGKNITYKKSFHSLRHTFVSRLTNAGVDPEIRRKLAGHASVEVHEIYTHHNIERMREAIRNIG